MKKQLLLFLTIALFSQSFTFAQDYTLLYDGINSRVQYPSDAALDVLNGATDYTIEAWIKPTSTDIHNKAIIKRYYQFALFMYQDANRRVYFTHYNNGTGADYVNSTYNVININEWNHIVVINNSTDNTCKLYVNGVDVTADSSGNAITHTALTLEANPDDADATYHPNFYVGYSGTSGIPEAYIDKVRVKNIAVDPATLQTSITDTAYSTDANTIILMNFNEGTGDVTLNEASGTNANLECYGGCAEIPTWETVANTLAVNNNNTIDFSISPNPVIDNFFTVQAKDNEFIQKVELTDLQGKLIQTTSFDTNENNARISTKGLNTGLYILKTTTNVGVGTKKLMIK